MRDAARTEEPEQFVAGVKSPLRVLTSGKANKKRKFVLTPGYASHAVKALDVPGLNRVGCKISG